MKLPSGPFADPSRPPRPVARRAAPAGPASASAPGSWRLIPAIAGRLATRQAFIELYGLPGYHQTLKWPRAEGFAATPRDFRPCDPAVGRAILGGRFMLAGATLEAQGPEDPWNRPSPSRAFAVALHEFAWLPSLMLAGEKGAREALRLTLGWHAVFSHWSPFSWAPEILARRVFNLACAARRMAGVANEADRALLADILARQGRQLLRPPGGVAEQATQRSAAAVAGCALGGKAGASLRRRALGRLPGSLRRAVREDGAHAGRSPQAGLELLLDLLTLEDALLQLGEAPPPELALAAGRLTIGLRTLTLPDGRLASFQGGAALDPALVAAARAHDEDDPGPVEGPGPGGYARVHSPLVTLVVDAAAPAAGPWSAAACAQAGALEIICGRDRIITNCGWTPRVHERQALRLTPAGSTLALGDGSMGEPLAGWKAGLLGPRLIGHPIHVEVEHRAADGAVWLEVEHDGWSPRYGLKHQRRLYLDQRLDELRAEERLHPCERRPDAARPLAAPYAVRFHLEPGVQASLARDKRSILLRGASGRGWWFRSDAPDVDIEPSIHVVDGLTRRSLQLVLRGSARTDNETKIRWKLSPAGASGDPV